MKIPYSMINASLVKSRKWKASDFDARVQTAHPLATGLEGLSRSELDRLWLVEGERRNAEMESGDVKGILGEEVFARIEWRHAK